jgi:hypothetical protein
MFVSVNKFCRLWLSLFEFLKLASAFHALDPNQSESIRISKEYVYLDPSRYFGSKARGGGAAVFCAEQTSSDSAMKPTEETRLLRC